jgi:hypothetical protein
MMFFLSVLVTKRCGDAFLPFPQVPENVYLLGQLHRTMVTFFWYHAVMIHLA